MKRKTLFVVVLVVIGCSSWQAPGKPTTKVDNADQLRGFYGLDKFTKISNLSSIKIAVLDRGFKGFETDKSFLPKSAVLVEQYDPRLIKRHQLGDPQNHVPLELTTSHGLQMAQIIWAMTGFNENGPKFYLLNANGPINYQRAMRWVMGKTDNNEMEGEYGEKMDIVLFAQNYICCGNFNGDGALNEALDRVAQKGIIPIIAAGNYGRRIYDGPIVLNNDGHATFQTAKDHLVFHSNFANNPTEITLNWYKAVKAEKGSYQDGTDKDLDLYVIDSDGNRMASERRQVMKNPDYSKGESLLARELVRIKLGRGAYRIEVKAKQKNFDKKVDRLRISIIADDPLRFSEVHQKPIESIDFKDATRANEIMVPADNRFAIAVGNLEAHSSVGPTSDGRIKPEVLLPKSLVIFDDGFRQESTSTASAIFAGIVTVLKTEKPGLTREDTLRLAHYNTAETQTLSSPLAEVSHHEVARAHPIIYRAVYDALGKRHPLLVARNHEGVYLLALPVELSQFQRLLRLQPGIEVTLEQENLRVSLRRESSKYLIIRRAVLPLSQPGLPTERNPRRPWQPLTPALVTGG